MESTEQKVSSAVVFEFNSDAQVRSHFERSHRYILLGGGLGSGKTVLHGLDLKERAKHESDQLGGIFTNTQNTLEKGVFLEIAKLYRSLGQEIPIFGRRPPIAWFRRWERDGVVIPTVPAYRNILTAPEGTHALCGTLHNQNWHQYETIQFGWIRLEEAINNTFEAVSTMTERVRCLTGGENNPDCARYHHHTRHLIFNPPRGPHPWLVPYLDQLEAAAKDFYHPLAPGEHCNACVYLDSDGYAHPKAHGADLVHSGWPLLQAGVGNALLIRSKTSDNARNQDRGYRAGLAANMSKDTARRRLDGEIVRETAGRAYADYSVDNVYSGVPYDADRTLYLCLDFNLEPRAAVFAHPLVPGRGEFPSEHERAGVTHIGAFGEYFYAGEMSDRKFALALIRGDRGAGFDTQPRYRSEEHRGLPPSCNERCEKVCRKGHWNGLKAHRGRIIGFGDQRGTHRSSHGDNLESSWQIVNQEFSALGNYGTDIPEEQPSPRARVDSVNGKLCSALDLHSLWIHPRCEELGRDLEQVMWDDTGLALREWRRGAMGTEWHRTHESDGLGYMIHRLFPLGHEIDGASGMPVMSFAQFTEPVMR
jgi:hypothetical protein